MVDDDDNEDGDDDGEEEEGDDYGGVGTVVGWEGVIAANLI